MPVDLQKVYPQHPFFFCVVVWLQYVTLSASSLQLTFKIARDATFFHVLYTVHCCLIAGSVLEHAPHARVVIFNKHVLKKKERERDGSFHRKSRRQSGSKEFL